MSDSPSKTLSSISQDGERNDMVDWINEALEKKEINNSETKASLLDLRKNVLKAPETIVEEGIELQGFGDGVEFTPEDQDEFLQELEVFLEQNPNREEAKSTKSLYEFLFRMIREEQLESKFSDQTMEQVMKKLSTLKFLLLAGDVNITQVSQGKGAPIIMIPQTHKHPSGEIFEETIQSQTQIFQLLEALYTFGITNLIGYEGTNAPDLALDKGSLDKISVLMGESNYARAKGYEKRGIENLSYLRSHKGELEKELQDINLEENSPVNEELKELIEEGLKLNRGMIEHWEQLSSFNPFQEGEPARGLFELKSGILNVRVYPIEPEEELKQRVKPSDMEFYNMWFGSVEKPTIQLVKSISSIVNHFAEQVKTGAEVEKEQETLQNQLEALEKKHSNFPELVAYVQAVKEMFAGRIESYTHENALTLAVKALSLGVDLAKTHTLDLQSPELRRVNEARQSLSLDNMKLITKHFNAPAALIFGADHFENIDESIKGLKSFETMCQEKNINCIRIDTASQKEKFTPGSGK
jgi:hypothetical protein